MGLPSLVDLTTELEKLLTATWHAVRAFAVAWRTYSRVQPQIQASTSLEEHQLPSAYGRTRLVVLPVDPYAVRAYWEITPAAIAKAAGSVETDIDRLQAILRFQEQSMRVPSFDIQIDLGQRNRHVALWSPGRSYDVDLGFKTKDGRFVSMVREMVVTPRGWPQPAVQEEFVRISGPDRQVEVMTPPEEPRRIPRTWPAIPPAPVTTREVDLTATAERRFIAGMSSSPGAADSA
jgi:hypothetical protein